MTAHADDMIDADRSYNRGKTFKVDMTPTGSGLLPLYLDILADPTSKAPKADIRAELIRMAQLADLYVASTKSAA
jgi:hypothetical protein